MQLGSAHADGGGQGTDAAVRAGIEHHARHQPLDQRLVRMPPGVVVVGAAELAGAVARRSRFLRRGVELDVLRLGPARRPAGGEAVDPRRLHGDDEAAIGLGRIHQRNHFVPGERQLVMHGVTLPTGNALIHRDRSPQFAGVESARCSSCYRRLIDRDSHVDRGVRTDVIEKATAEPATGETGEALAVGLASVNVGLPRIIGHERSGEAILSGIVKTPVTADELYLDTLNLEGDRQADLTVHGGLDKAVYAYPAEHLPRWNDELGVTFGPGTFGENLTTTGWTEDEVRIGDVWAWGRRPPPGLAAAHALLQAGNDHRPAGSCPSVSCAPAAAVGTCACCNPAWCRFPARSRSLRATRPASPSSWCIARLSPAPAAAPTWKPSPPSTSWPRFGVMTCGRCSGNPDGCRPHNERRQDYSTSARVIPSWRGISFSVRHARRSFRLRRSLRAASRWSMEETRVLFHALPAGKPSATVFHRTGCGERGVRVNFDMRPPVALGRLALVIVTLSVVFLGSLLGTQTGRTLAQQGASTPIARSSRFRPTRRRTAGADPERRLRRPGRDHRAADGARSTGRPGAGPGCGHRGRTVVHEHPARPAIAPGRADQRQHPPFSGDRATSPSPAARSAACRVRPGRSSSSFPSKTALGSAASPSSPR